jgi:cycloeucalenol cycloisomerase
VNGRWFSEDPEVAHTERAVLAASPIWMVAMGVVMLGGLVHGWGDVEYLVFSIACGLSVGAAPWLIGPRATRPGARGYAVRLNLWVFVLVAFGTYVGTAYFFDLMGMKYAFPVTWMLQSDVVGRSGQTVPVFMYPLTQAYFLTYFVVLQVVYRRIVTGLSPGPLGRALVVAVLAYTIAFLETLSMANDAIARYFEYADRQRMLLLGSWGYAAYFVIGLPMVRRLPGTTLGGALLQALGTSMGILVLLELWAQLIGPL